ncbi:hypothetical protein EJ04DRAFT_544332 [Polyplosphaeria fusca]|uniref:Polysaccharide export protein n=1 Tax=Polyplosphaeria fusca TaxID=682080 RepID=A0A9P4QXY6_9PLEO|nr:hypothetical protein EJ04DRAFT_544332 [Polyplosphaeria fusca]
MRFTKGRRCRSPTLKALLFLFVFFTALEITRVRRSLAPPNIDIAPARPERIYIASLHWNNERILRSHWNQAVTALATALGPQNVFITVYESGSWDNSKGALRELDSALEQHGIRRNITLSDVTHIDEMNAPNAGPGWIETPRTRRELRRIPYLSRLRNITLEPLQDLVRNGEHFDKVLFLNDVVFTNNDVFQLLNTNYGDYAAACSLDFSKPPSFYDTFALRDSEGHEMLTKTWPYFRSRASRHALTTNRATPVRSCWNGMVVMPAEPFIATPPLSFRGTPDSLALHHLEGSECCLIHADNPLSSKAGVFVNPNVRVGYNGDAYKAVHPDGPLLSSWQIFKGLWDNRFRRWTTTVWFKEWIVHRRVVQWRGEDKHNNEPGEFCLINEMQVLIENGWKHL